MYYLKIGDELYKAEFTGRNNDKDWDGRESKTITLDFNYATAISILYDNVEWHIYRPNLVKQQVMDENGEPVFDEKGEPVLEDVDMSEDYDNSAFSIRGDVTAHPDGRTSIKMGKPTDLEQAYELLYGGM